MITKFLYRYSKEKRKILSGLVENDEVIKYDPLKRFQLALENINVEANEHKIISKGKVGYIVFKGEEDMYLDVNIFNDEVKIQLTNNISHASCYSEEFFAAVLDYAEYFGYDDDPIFVDSGLKFDGEMYTDSYTIFKNITDASYCKLNINDEVFFIARTDDQKYYLTKKFEDASKVAKNELRRVLLINEFVNKNTSKSNVSFSSYKYLSNENGEFIYAGRNPYKLSFNDNHLVIELNPIIDTNFKLRDNEETFLQLKDVSYLITKEKSDKSFYLEIDSNKYIKKNKALDYELVSNPYDATFLNDYDIEIIKSAFKVINPNISILRKNKDKYLYYEGNTYIITNDAKEEYNVGKILTKLDYEDFLKAFDISFNNSKRDKGTILICNDKYLNIEIINKNSFKVLLTDSAYNASIFKADEAKAIKNILGFDFKERSLDNIIFTDLRAYNITLGKANIALNYRNIMQDILSKKSPISDYTDTLSLKLETEKASLEYLRRFYLKAVFDYKNLFEMALTENVKNILIVAPRLNLELQGLDLALKNDVNVYTLNENKFGYLPNVQLTHAKFKGTYRLKLSNVPKSFISQFDLIVFGGSFNEGVDTFKSTMDEIIQNSKDVTFLNSRIIGAQNDMFYNYFKEYTKVNRKYYTYEFPYGELALEFDDKYVSYLIKNGGKIHNKLALNKEDSYYSIIKVKNGKIEE